MVLTLRGIKLNMYDAFTLYLNIKGVHQAYLMKIMSITVSVCTPCV